jgi:hypothetical protein
MARYRTCSLKWCAIHCTHNGKAVSTLLLRSYLTYFNQIWYSGPDPLCFSEAAWLISTRTDIQGKICPHRYGHLIWVITSELKSLFHTKLKLKVITFLRKDLSTKIKLLNLTLVQISLGSTVLFIAVIIWVTNYIQEEMIRDCEVTNILRFIFVVTDLYLQYTGIMDTDKEE